MRQSFSKPLLEGLCVFLFLAIHWLLGVWAVSGKSATQDEPLHLTSGYTYWMFNDYRMQPENGNLPQRLAALPLLWMDLAFIDPDSPDWRHARQFHVSSDFLYELGNDAGWMLFAARCVMMTVSVLICLTVYLWARRLWGLAGAWISLLLAVFSTELLAHGPLTTSDAVFALAVLWFLGALWRLLHRLDIVSVALLGVAAAMVAAAKYSVVVVLPVAIILLLLRLANPAPLACGFGFKYFRSLNGLWGRISLLGSAVLISVVIAWILVWALYGFRYEAFADSDGDNRFYRNPVEALPEDSATGAFFEWAEAKRILPQAYLHGALYAYVHSLERSAYFLGEKGTGGWPAYFPVAFLVKAQLPLILLLLGGSILFITSCCLAFRYAGGRAIGKKLYPTAPLLVFFFLYWAFAITGNLNIGFRHMLPVFPVMFILLGGLGALAGRKPLAAGLFIVPLLLWYAVEALRIHPHYLAYFNTLAGGPEQGYYFLVDSSLDWGQDIPSLAQWQLDHISPEQADNMHLALFTAANRHYHGVRGIDIFGFGGKYGGLEMPQLGEGYYAFSVTLLMGPYFYISEPWTREHERYYLELMQTVEALVDKSDGDPALLAKRMLDDPQTDWARLFARAIHFRMEKLRYFLLSREPVDRIGHSIFVYKLTAEDLEQALANPTVGFPPDFRLRRAFELLGKMR